MIYRTLSGAAAIALLALGACSSIPQTATAEAVAPDPTGWRLASGKLPTPAEFTALTASCQDAAARSILALPIWTAKKAVAAN